MDKKDNLNKALFDMFGVGKDPAAEKPQEAEPQEFEPQDFGPQDFEPQSFEPEAPAAGPEQPQPAAEAFDFDAAESASAEEPEAPAVPEAPSGRFSDPFVEDLSLEVKDTNPAPEAYAAPAPEASHICTYLAADTSMEGTLRTKSDVEIVGKFKGDIISEGRVVLRSSLTGNVTARELFLVGCALAGDAHVAGRYVLDQNSQMVGNIYAGEFLCAGKLKGDMDISGTVSLAETASVNGNMKIGLMNMAHGAVICGNIEMQSAKPAKAGKSK